MWILERERERNSFELMNWEGCRPLHSGVFLRLRWEFRTNTNSKQIYILRCFRSKRIQVTSLIVVGLTSTTPKLTSTNYDEPNGNHHLLLAITADQTSPGRWWMGSARLPWYIFNPRWCNGFPWLVDSTLQSSATCFHCSPYNWYCMSHDILGYHINQNQAYHLKFKI